MVNVNILLFSMTVTKATGVHKQKKKKKNVL